MSKILLLFLWTIILLACVHVDFKNSPCRDRMRDYGEFKKKLSQLYEEDQGDRVGSSSNMTPQHMASMLERDEKRRIEVARFFARGCLKSADDYKKTALIFQHGVIPEHFYQAFLWATMAVRLGDKSALQLANLSIDRFLVNSGFKQLFGSQALKPSNGPCWCLYPIEASFTDQDRRARSAKPVAAQLEWLKTLNADARCPEVYCAMELKPVAKDDFPEFW
jgi:hypothetical protein